jgi:chromosome segregation ATPase
MSRALAFAVIFVCFAPFACAAQSTDPGSQVQSQTPAAAAPQTASQNTNAASAVASDQTKKKSKKVWTNEEIPSAGGNVSVVGDSAQSHPGNGTTNSAKGNNAQRIESYRKQILQYQKQMDALDKQIAEFRNFKADNSSGGMDPHMRYTMTPSEDRIKQLEDKKKQIQAKIDVLEDAARKEGIEPGQLR